MSRTFLQLIQQAADELGIPEPSQIVGAVDDTSRQLLALAQREGKQFSVLANGEGGWNNLHKEYVFFTAVNAATTGNITNGSRVITNIGSLTNVAASIWSVTGTGLPTKAQIVSVDSSSQITMDRPATATTIGVSLVFAQNGYGLPSDFEYFTQKTYWDGSYRWQLLGPISAQEKQVLRYGISPVGPRRRFYVRSNYLYLDPIPSTNNETLAYDYYSNAYCRSSGGTAQSKWTADTDLYNLDEDCFILGMKWRYLRAKALDYGEEKDAYDSACMRVMARDGGNRDLPLTASTGLRFLNTENVPDTGFGA